MGEGGQYRLLLVTDLDDTVVREKEANTFWLARPRTLCCEENVDHSDISHEGLHQLNNLWNKVFLDNSQWIYSTGRSLELYKSLASSSPLREPDQLITSVGTEIWRQEGDDLKLDSEWIEHLNVEWDRDAIASISDQFGDSLKKQEPSEQRPHKISYHFRNTDTSEHLQVIQQLKAAIKSSGFAVKVIYASNKCVDILPERAGKGSAVSWLLDRRRFDSAVLCGDSGNDIDMMKVAASDTSGKISAVIVSNATPELADWAECNKSSKIFRATEQCSKGIIQGLKHYGLLP